MNDAVAIVLYRTLLVFRTEDVTGKSIAMAFGNFFKIFIGSTAIGIMFGLVSSLIYKYTHLRDKEFFFMEVRRRPERGVGS